MARVFVVSPLPAVRAGLRAMLGLADDLTVVGEADRLGARESGPGALGIDALVVDAGAELEDDLGHEGLGPGVVILGPVAGDERLPIELAGRGWGYLARSAGADALIGTVRAVAGGLLVIDPSIGGHLLARIEMSTVAAGTEQGEDLTAREREVLQLVALGLANKTIAARLGISEHTVKFHVAAILGKLGAGSRTEAVHLGARRGLVVL